MSRPWLFNKPAKSKWRDAATVKVGELARKYREAVRNSDTRNIALFERRPTLSSPPRRRPAA